HEQGRGFPIVSEVEHRDDVAVLQSGSRARFTIEARACLFVTHDALGHHLDRDLPIEIRIMSEVERPHAAARNEPLNPVLAYSLHRHFFTPRMHVRLPAPPLHSGHLTRPTRASHGFARGVRWLKTATAKGASRSPPLPSYGADRHL